MKMILDEGESEAIALALVHKIALSEGIEIIDHRIIVGIVDLHIKICSAKKCTKNFLALTG
jgi:predicted nucleic acid-binding protein